MRIISRLGLIAAIAALAAACAADTTPTSTAPPPASTALLPTATAVLPTATAVQPTLTPTETEAPAGTPPAEVASDIEDFTLQDVTVGVGDRLTWTNQGARGHTTTSGASGTLSGLWESGRLDQGDTFSYTFAEAGSFPYFCAFHPSRMLGVITVTDR